MKKTEATKNSTGLNESGVASTSTPTQVEVSEVAAQPVRRRNRRRRLAAW